MAGPAAAKLTSAVSVSGRHSPWETGSETYMGHSVMPAMSDAPLRGYKGRHEWFWEPGDEEHVFPLENLVNMYCKSVGHNTSLILGLTPDPDGLMPEPDVQRLKEFGEEIKRRFSHPVASTSGSGDILNLKFPIKQKVNQIVIQEDIALGERVRKFVLTGKTNKGWEILFEGSCIGHKFIHRFDGREVSEIRLQIPESIGEAKISNFQVFNVE